MATDRWEQDFDVYFTMVDERPASFVIDLNAAAVAPVESHPLLLGIKVPMRIAREDGLRDARELEALGELEDQFVEALEQKVDALYVGRTVHAGDTTLYFYVPAAHRAALDGLPDVTGPAGDYAPEWWVDDDPEWNLYLDYLAPGPYEAQAIWNRRLVQTFQEGGDQLAVPRDVDHLAYFATREQADAAAEALRAAGFRTDDVAGPDDDALWSLQFHRADALADGRPDAFVAEILDIVLPQGGDYDGWGAPMVKG